MQAKVPLATVAMEMDNHHTTAGQHGSSGSSGGGFGGGGGGGGVGVDGAASADVAQFDVVYRVVKVSPKVTDAVTALLEKKIITPAKDDTGEL